MERWEPIERTALPELEDDRRFGATFIQEPLGAVVRIGESSRSALSSDRLLGDEPTLAWMRSIGAGRNTKVGQDQGNRRLRSDPVLS